MLKANRRGLADILTGLGSWRTWKMLAWNDVRRRYRRSGLGQFWLTLSMAATVGGLGFVYSHLFGVDVSTYLPYIAVTFVIWGIISTVIVDSCNALIENEQLLRHVPLPRSLFTLRVIARNIVIAAHNVIIIPIVFIWFGVGVNLNILWIVVGLALLIVNAFWIGYFLSIMCARFRDVPQIVTSAMQVVFFITPVMYLPDQLARRGFAVVRWNPFASLLEVVRDPLLGSAPSAWALGSCAIMAVVGLAVVIPFAGRYAPRVVYWL
jgi:ABC-type polysaccharide/polyol phosphate export permease